MIRVVNQKMILIFSLVDSTREEIMEWLEEHFPKKDWDMWSVEYRCPPEVKIELQKRGMGFL